MNEDRLSPEEIRTRFDYDPSAGHLIWLLRPEKPGRGGSSFNSKFAGRRAHPQKDSRGYHQGRIDGRFYLTHRVVWAFCHGEWPNGDIDHINGVKTDNRIENLRVVDAEGNAKNAKHSKNNSSGTTGVRWREQSKQWNARIGHQGRLIDLGLFDAFDAAVAARKTAEIKYGYHPNHGRKIA